MANLKRTRIPQLTCVLLLAATAAACGGIGFFERFTGDPPREREVAAPPDVLWERVTARVGELGLIVESVEPSGRMIQFGWMTAPGDGRLYLDCNGAPRVGSASFRPRVLVRPAADGSSVIVSTETRTTADSRCVSTGRFERWLLQRFDPAMEAAVAASSDTDAGHVEGVARDR